MSEGEPLEPFDVCAALPGPGVTLLEASAGTGKTFTIASLAARYLAAGVAVDQLLVVTFTRAATGELRDRVRHRLLDAWRGLSRVLGGWPVRGDAVVELLCRGTPTELLERQEAIGRALRRFDAATIATTHGFCQQMLGGLGVTGEPLYDVAFVEDLGDLVAEVADDLLVGRAVRGDPVELRRAQAISIARKATDYPDVDLEPSSGLASESADWQSRRLAQSARRLFEERKAARSLIGYDDLQQKLRDALLEPAAGAPARRRLAARYQVVLVDEFQDTDPVQWQVLEAAFVESGATVVLIGDPKQAIYSFRGADVFTYLDAAGRADRRAGLGVNWRSDAGLLDGFDALFDGAQLGNEGIVYRSVAPAPDHVAPRLSGAPVGAPLRVRVVERAGRSLTSRGQLVAEDARAVIVADLVADIVGLLGSAATLPDAAPSAPAGARRGVRAGDIAVLVRRNVDAHAARDALGDAGVPAVMLGTDSVFQSAAAATWLDLLEALDRPGDRARVAGFALGDFAGWSAERLATAGDDERAGLSALLHAYDAELRERGVAALYSSLLRGGDVPGRILCRQDGERTMTDLAHVAELLHAAAIEEQLGERALTGWLRRRIDAAADEGNAEGLSRRLERDVDAVQVVTVHRSKGLEFPIVYAPMLWNAPWTPDEAPFVYHDASAGDRRVLDVGRASTNPASAEHHRIYLHEEREELLRLAYVALTRARHQAVLWWAPVQGGGQSALGRLVFERRGGSALADDVGLPKDERAWSAFEALAGRAPPGTVSIERVPLETSPPSRPPNATGVAGHEVRRLEPAGFTRAIDWSWRRTSYSGLVAASHADPAGADPAVAEALDDELAPQSLAPSAGGEAARTVPLARLPGGVDVGTFVHRVLQELDFASPNLHSELRRLIESTPGRERLAPGEREVLAEGLVAAIDTPLGPSFGELSLRQVRRPDRLDELSFELPLAGGEAPTGELRL
ncbi:MAG TPA: UvrD-helicase domain-containing protein, partial [Acidimicrobiales bacterium]|nr:UvrD-helicase domain-containing protein [Acidimicrobiales bacterium]